MANESARTGAWAPLRRSTFRNLWLAQLGSNVGGWMQSVGAQWFLVENTHSPALVAWVQTASLLPVLLLSIIAGVMADSLDRRKLLITMTALSAVTAGVLVVLDLTGVLAPWSLLLVTFLLGSLTALTNPAWQAIQPELVPRSEIPASASLGSVTVNGARAIGPAIAGVIVGLAGPWAVFALNSVSFLGVLVVLARWKRPKKLAPLGREGTVAALLAGLRYVRAAPGVRRILLRSALFAVPASALWALLPSISVSVLRLSATGYGLLLGVLGVGAVAGVFLLPVLTKRMKSGWLLAGSAAAFALGSAAPASGRIALVIPAFLLAGVAWIVTLTTLNAALQLTLAEWVRARGVAMYLLVFMGSQGIAAFVWGILASGIGIVPTMLIAAVVLLLVALSVLPLPLHPETGRLDRTITALGTSQPSLVFEPDPADGPVTIAFDYIVEDGRETDFVNAMKAVERSRRRTGATAWKLERNGDTSHAYREEFTARSWGEFRRGNAERWTGYDHSSLEAALAFTSGEVAEHHYFPTA